MRFGERAKKIQNQAKINREWTVAELRVLLEKAELEIVRLKRLAGADSTYEVPPKVTCMYVHVVFIAAPMDMT